MNGLVTNKIEKGEWKRKRTRKWKLRREYRVGGKGGESSVVHRILERKDERAGHLLFCPPFSPALLPCGNNGKPHVLREQSSESRAGAAGLGNGDTDGWPLLQREPGYFYPRLWSECGPGFPRPEALHQRRDGNLGTRPNVPSSKSHHLKSRWGIWPSLECRHSGHWHECKGHGTKKDAEPGSCKSCHRIECPSHLRKHHGQWRGSNHC